MSFSYNSETLSTRDQLRLQLSDTSATAYVFEDGELDALLSRAGDDINLAAAMGCRSLAVNHARRAIWYRINNLQVDRRDPAKTLRQMAEDFEKAARAVPFEYVSLLEELVDSAGQDLSNYDDTESSES